MDHGSEGQIAAGGGPQFRKQLIQGGLGDYCIGPGCGNFSPRPIWQFDQVAGFRVSRVSGPPQHFNILVVQRMMGMGYAHDLVIARPVGCLLFWVLL